MCACACLQVCAVLPRCVQAQAAGAAGPVARAPLGQCAGMGVVDADAGVGVVVGVSVGVLV